MAKKFTNKTSYSYSSIKWTRSDIARLSNAVRTFNKEVKKHMDSIPLKALPKLKEYSKVKSEITSRKDLELAISTLNKIKNKSAFKLVSSEVNPRVKFTNWELQTAKRYDYRNQVKLQTEYNKFISEIKKTSKPQLDMFGNPILDEQGRPMAKVSFSSEYKNKLESYLSKSNVEMLMESKDYHRLNQLLERIYKRGTDTFEFEKAKLYKEKYLETLEDYANLDNYEAVREKLESIPEKEFYKFLVESGRINGEKSYEIIKELYNNRMLQSEFNTFARDIRGRYRRNNRTCHRRYILEGDNM